MPAKGLKHIPVLQNQHLQWIHHRIVAAVNAWQMGTLAPRDFLSPDVEVAIRAMATSRGIDPDWFIGALYSYSIIIDEALEEQYKQLVLSG